MNRKEVYRLIQEHELGDVVKNRFGDNYTRVSTKQLEQVIWDFDATLVDECPYDDAQETEEVNSTHDGSDDTTDWEETAQEVSNSYEAACVAFVGILKDSGLLDGILAKL